MSSVAVQTVGSSIGSKVVVAVTGIGLLGFVIGHLLGNLLIYGGPNALNGYAKALEDNLALLWTARLGLLSIFVLHVGLSVRLSLRNRAARPVRYACEGTVRASYASRTMLYSGLVILAFVIYHLLHFTFGV